jgi:hypothetical protein
MRPATVRPHHFNTEPLIRPSKAVLGPAPHVRAVPHHALVGVLPKIRPVAANVTTVFVQNSDSKAFHLLDSTLDGLDSWHTTMMHATLAAAFD